ncbi:MAG: choice-of-anchor J domain-containing protein [Bacteroidaceae bacterium]|nr:choice-of-anchor J domain-containing protein [Bacteroidaceae bacterium]
MNTKSLLMTLLVLACVSMAKAGEIEVGYRTSLCGNELPVTSGQLYSLTQQNFHQEDIGGAVIINTLGFFNSGDWFDRSLDIYMSEEYVGSSTSPLEVSEDEKVFSGTVTFMSDDWATIVLDKPFRYKGEGSLIITVNSINNTNWVVFQNFPLVKVPTSGRSFAIYGDDEPYDPTDILSYNLMDVGPLVNQIQINGKTIGEPSISSNSLPTESSYPYAISEQIYTNFEMGGAGFIKNLSFYNIGDVAERYIDLYLVHTSKECFDGTDDWLDVSPSDKVFSGKVNFKKEDWTTIGLRVPFEYNGRDNLAVVVYDRSGYTSPSSKLKCITYFASGEQSLCYYAYQPLDPTGMTEDGMFDDLSTKNMMKFNIERKPFEIAGSQVTLNSFIPTNTSYNYSLSEQIFTTDELGSANMLSSVSFYNAGKEVNRELEIYLVPTNKDEFLTNSDYIEYDESNKVYGSNVCFYEDDWTTITFDWPYYYDGKSNLVLIVNDISGWQEPGIECLAFESGNYQTIYNYRNNSMFENPSDVSVGWASLMVKKKNQVIFNKEEEYLGRPYFLYIDPEAYSATVEWQGDGNSWNLQYKREGDDSWTTIADLRERSYELTGLKCNTNYRLRIQSVYSAKKVSHWTPITFTTQSPVPTNYDISVTPNSATINWTGYSDRYEVRYRKTNKTFFCDFESITDGQIPPDWTTEDRDGDGYGWIVAPSYYHTHSGNVCLTSASFFQNTALQPDNWLISPLVKLDGTLKVWLRGQDDSGNLHDHFRIYALSEDGSEFHVLLPETLSQNTYTEYTMDLSPLGGQMGFIEIQHSNCSGQGSLNLDDICIFTDEPEGTWATVYTDEPQITLSGLPSNTKYEFQVTAVKEGEENVLGGLTLFSTLARNPKPFDIAATADDTSADISWSGFSDSYTVRYRTMQREEIDKVTLEEDFESGLNNWTIITNGDSPQGSKGWFASSESTHGGSYAASAWSYLPDEGSFDADNWLISPQITLGGVMSFWEANASDEYFDTYEVLLSTTGNSVSDFTTTLFDMHEASYFWENIDVDLSPYEGQKGYIAFHHKNNAKSGILIDDIRICSYKTIPPGQWKTVTTNKTEAKLSGLMPETPYEYQVVGTKSGEADASSDSNFFTTLNALFDLVLDANNSNEQILLDNWGKYVNATLKNYVFKKDNSWSTICLPFDMELEGSILEGADIRAFSGSWPTEDSRFLILDFLIPVTKVEAGLPYLIRWDRGKDVVDPVFKKVIINLGVQYYDDWWVGFYGTYSSGTTTDPFIYVLDGNLDLSPLMGMPGGIKAFQAFFYSFDEWEGIGLNVGDIGETITGVDAPSMTQSPQDDVIYNLAGQRLSKMQKGINIVNGKKILVP